MQKIILGTSNLEKIEDIKYSISVNSRYIFNNSDILTLHDVSDIYDIHIPDAEENGRTVEENCMSKILTYKDILGKIDDLYGGLLISEDTGLFIRELDWNPGVRTSRFAGDHDFDKLGKKVMELMNGVDDRYAFVKSAVGFTVIGYPELYTNIQSSSIEGSISEYIYEGEGYPFDKIFHIKGYPTGVTLAESCSKNKAVRLELPRSECIELLLDKFRPFLEG